MDHDPSCPACREVASLDSMEADGIVDGSAWTVPAHYDAEGRWCAGGGQAPNQFGKCPFGCDHADHYANDGHPECADDWCSNPQCPKAGACGGECVRNF
jgi:hypothetical protein